MKLAALGELLIDFTPAGISDSGNVLFERNPGGAPANVLTGFVKLGGQGEFIGKVGDDQFGSFLEQTLKANGVGTRGLVFSKDVNTTLAFVHLYEDGDRDFSFYRKPGADITLEESEIDFDIILDADAFHFGSLSMTDEPARSATVKAVEFAKDNKKIISYDPNWRPPLWKSKAQAKTQMEWGIKYADILKLSEIELELLTDESDLEAGCKKLLAQGPGLVLVTLGAKGCFYHFNGHAGYLETYDVKVTDTTGAGDAFLGAFLYRFFELSIDLDDIDIANLIHTVDFGNAAGALCTTKKGAIPAMPDLEEVRKCIKNTAKLMA